MCHKKNCLFLVPIFQIQGPHSAHISPCLNLITKKEMNEHHYKVFQEQLNHDCKPWTIPFDYWKKNEKGEHDIVFDNFEFPEEMGAEDFREKIFILFNNHMINKYGAEFTLQRLYHLKRIVVKSACAEISHVRKEFKKKSSQK